MKKRKVNPTFVPPKISFFTRAINGVDTKIKLVRDSLICRLFTKQETLVVGHTIYAKNKIVTKKVFDAALKKMK